MAIGDFAHLRTLRKRGSLRPRFFQAVLQGVPLTGVQVLTGRPRFGSVRLRFGGGTVREVPVFGSGGSSAKKGFSVFQLHSVQVNRKGRLRFQFRFLETVPAVPVPLSVSGKTVPTVPVLGAGSVPESPCFEVEKLILLHEKRVRRTAKMK